MRAKQNTLSARASQRFERWVAEPLNRQAFRDVVATWDAADARALRTLASLVDEHGASLRRRSAAKARRRRTSSVLAAATVAILIAFVPTDTRRDGRHVPMTVVTRANEPQEMTLDDGSIVNVAPSTRLTINIDSTHRSMHLTRGRAEFAVAPDPARPFKVTTPTILVVAKGTRFSVHRQDNASTVSVSEGVVEVSMRGGGLSVSLPAGEDISIADDGSRLASLDEMSGWLTLNDVSVGEAVAEFNRANATQIKIGTPEGMR
jgi:transmembrane sensor